MTFTVKEVESTEEGMEMGQRKSFGFTRYQLQKGSTP